MITNKKKATPAGTGAASSTALSHQNHSIRSQIKVEIIRMALWGVLPVALAEWMIQRGGLLDD